MHEVTCYATPLGCEPAKLPFNYLGIPVRGNMNLKKNWRTVIERFLAKLSVWKLKTLSIGGCLTLSKAVLGNLLTYYFTLFFAPIGIINTLESIRRKFLWGTNDDGKRKVNWVSWQKLISPKKAGDLGLGSLRALN